mmetsp:Transcript_3395/g.6907  ORF Transcript_3395/g.6907 Transcript_3395/m.6907 type:complete len:228 (-) Transcript_3395:1349-2032(-)
MRGSMRRQCSGKRARKSTSAWHVPPPTARCYDWRLEISCRRIARGLRELSPSCRASRIRCSPQLRPRRRKQPRQRSRDGRRLSSTAPARCWYNPPSTRASSRCSTPCVGSCRSLQRGFSRRSTPAGRSLSMRCCTATSGTRTLWARSPSPSIARCWRWWIAQRCWIERTLALSSTPTCWRGRRSWWGASRGGLAPTPTARASRPSVTTSQSSSSRETATRATPPTSS